MFLNNSYLDKEYKKAKTKTIIGIVLFVLALLSVVMIYVKINNARKNVTHLNKIIISNERRTDRLAYVDVAGYISFASYGDQADYYFIHDEYYYYIIKIYSSDYETFLEKYNKGGIIQIYGYTESIDEELKDIAISSFNEIMEDDILNHNNFDEYIGDVLLLYDDKAETGSASDLVNLAFEPTFGFIVTFIMGLTFFFSGFNTKKSFDNLSSNTLTDYDFVEKSINDENSIVYKKLKTIVADKFLLDYDKRLNVINYDDIDWAYITKHRTNFINDYSYLNIFKNDGKNLSISIGKTVGKANKETDTSLNDILNTIAQNNPNCLIGYNPQEYKNRKKNLFN